MTGLILASLAFLITHFGVSSTPLRSMLVARIGEDAYLGLYSLMALVTLGAMIWAFSAADRSVWFWYPGLIPAILTKTAMILALVLLVSGLMSPNPTSVKQQASVKDDVRGVMAITRHPVQWAILIWALAHLVSNGDLAAIIFFGSLAMVSGIGTLLIDQKYKNRNDDWQHFYSVSSNVPFGAIVSGQNRLHLADFNLTALAVSVLLYVLIYWFHGMMFGVGLF